MRTLVRELVIAKRRREDQHDRDVALAWTTEALHRQKRLPDLKSILTKRAVTQTPRQMATVLEHLSAAYRLPLRKAKRKTR